MPSHKQRRDRKRSHKHKHRNRGRSSVRKHNIQKKYEGKKENIPHNTSSYDADGEDICTYMENRGEMIRQMFCSVGEDFLAKSVPLILKATKEELKRICFEELTRMSADVALKILEGLPWEAEPDSSPENSSKKKSHVCKCSKNCCGHSSKSSSEEECCRTNNDSEDQESAVSKGGDEELSFDERKTESLGSSSSEEKHSESEKESSKNSEDDFSDEKNEAPSTSYQPSGNKKLAKVAPFHISMPKPEVPQPATLNEAVGLDSSEVDNEASFEMIDLGLEEDIGDGEDESNSQGGGAMNEAPPPVGTLNENGDGEIMTEEEMQQNLSEMLELEHRARAIRSMLANIDRFQA
ncbi:caspase activity and apoptosis inhibitor 1-like isoform X2 [Hetaerina americana]|uniref:caspase activity and apoptosis inhibitor 1-like isoform X2 n=1 Tax=Hetaerina americana TaxID=62018 RepID=UPI003A7F33BA